MKRTPISSLSWSSCVGDTPANPDNKSVDKQALMAGERKTGGLKAIAFVLANETVERLASFGMFANFMVYMMKVLHIDQVKAAYIMNLWFGVSNFFPLLGAFLSDAYTGRFFTIGFASFFSLLGMVTLTLSAWLPKFHPPPCTNGHQCLGPNQTQLGVLILGLVLLSIGSGGVRPCSIPFGVDQFDPTTEKGRKGIASYFNWYYTTFTIVVLIAQTVVVYVQDQVSWVIGFAIPTILMLFSIVLFFSGAKLYNHVKPEGSVFTSMAQVFVVACKKRRFKNDGDQCTVVLYDPPEKNHLVQKLARTSQYRFFDKAAIITTGNEITPSGTPANRWRLCSVQNVEEFKCLLRVFPIWGCGMISLTAMTQQWTFTISQALIMDCHLGSFDVPAASVSSVFSLLTIIFFIPFYDRVLVPALRRITGHDDGITLLQRIGIGIVFAILSMIVAGIVERARRNTALEGEPAMSAFWLVPHLVLMGLCEAFNMIGQIEFFNRQFPEHMRSVGNALLPCSLGGASYCSTLIIGLVRRATESEGHPGGWLAKDLNKGRLDYYYYLVGGLGVANLGLFLLCALRFTYKQSADGEANTAHGSVVVAVDMSSSSTTTTTHIKQGLINDGVF